MKEYASDASENWSLPKKGFLLFVWVYLITFPIHLYDPLDIWLGTKLFHIAKLERIKATGSGDTTLDYVHLFTSVVWASILSLLILFVDRNRPNYKWLYAFMIVYARYFLAMEMLFYGFVKTFPLQFGTLEYARLESSVGSSSPMGLLWTFMCASKPYTIFSGLCELLGGYLLLFRRTKAIGAMLCGAVLVNVAVLNFCYDVPVKLYSSNLLFIALVILAPDLRNMHRFFILHQPSLLNYDGLLLSERWQRISALVLKTGFILLFTCLGIYKGIHGLHSYGALAPLQPLAGSYKTVLFTLADDTLSPLTGDTLRWNKFTMDKGLTIVTTMDDKKNYFKAEVDTVKKSIVLTLRKGAWFHSMADTAISYHLKYVNADSMLTLTGSYNGKELKATFKKKAATDYPLISRGFHWINEYPYKW